MKPLNRTSLFESGAPSRPLDPSSILELDGYVPKETQLAQLGAAGNLLDAYYKKMYPGTFYSDNENPVVLDATDRFDDYVDALDNLMYASNQLRYQERQAKLAAEYEEKRIREVMNPSGTQPPATPRPPSPE